MIPFLATPALVELILIPVAVAITTAILDENCQCDID